ncbi:hypothetical protein GCM10010435_72330 [Winogradskya consettensis]|uniref:Uncharacterized protein n=1 Tax=Winogradskya consettensis TaxID=113560 RepID=A0A919W0A7_9ACTN|nr:hypothetical protein [Actinoplanes consettensis]GIM83573.1 hypothetical protein Aco04nite_87230 [Actinoplanes consettensis]
MIPALSERAVQNLRSAYERAVDAGAPVVPAGDVPAAAGGLYDPDLREVRWRVLAARGLDAGPQWGDSLSVALDRAGRAADGAVLGTRLLRSWWTGPSLPWGSGRRSSDTRPAAPLIGALSSIGVLGGHGPRRTLARRTLARRMLDRDGGMIVPLIEYESKRQAVRLGHSVVQSSAVLLAVLSFDAQITSRGRALHPRYVASNQGGRMLRDSGVTLAPAFEAAVDILDEGGDAFTFLPAAFSEAARDLLDIALTLGAPNPGTSHVVEATRETACPAADVLVSRLS